ncbi:hypothetical protein J4E83_005356 [Alternaria metachromatica]|uniref:uncharacterized protein n=1 Tax=Alternaria metachromatica TaxID=283354 RepID=UPI0020C3CD5A|nr:uncharacterized protein J4E83_005356 [Alternaria metachromatica]KAI4620993.1 hypothetical protein J4E83_005356 [Alternaria metachromatica]
MSTFSDLTRKEKRDIIRGEPFDGVQVTMAPKSIRDLLDTLASIPNNKLATTHPASASLALIDDNWGVDMTSFPPPPPMYGGRTFRPAGDAASWDLRLLATLAVLSEFTQGQGDYMGGQINSAVELRNIDKRTKKNLGVVFAVDVVRVIRDLLHPLNEDEYKEGALPARKRKAGFNDRRQSERKNTKATEQAVDTDMPVGGEAMERVEKKLRKTRLPDKVESDSEEEMLAPGERMV